MTEPEDVLLTDLRRVAVTVDPVPDALLARARAALAWRDTDPVSGSSGTPPERSRDDVR